MKSRLQLVILLSFFFVTLTPSTSGRASEPQSWAHEWPNTDFSKTSVDFSEIISGGPPKDGIPSIDSPKFAKAGTLTDADLAATEPVISIRVGGHMRAYPLRILTWHEIVNDTVGDLPITVTYCPLCNSSIVFDRRIDGKLLDFGTTGKLRNSDMVMYDRQTESWWQQFIGQGIVGEMTGRQLTILPSRLESFGSFVARAPQGDVLVANNPGMRNYGTNPYAGYDSAAMPFLFRGELPDYINPMVRVVVVGGKAWALPLLATKGQIVDSGLILSWTAGQNSALDQRRIRNGRDVGNVIAQRQTPDGSLRDVVYDVTFAFTYHAFHPDRRIITN